MKSKNIKIINLNELCNFVIKSSQVDGAVLAHRGQFCVDAKSLLGMMFINAAQECWIEYPESAIDFESYLKQFEK